MKVKIYTLSDPKTKLIRYVGKTTCKLNSRFNGHNCKSSLLNNTYKNNWIKQLKKKGLKPIIELLNEVDYKDWQFWEKHYISLIKSWGFKLTNLTDGGEGMNGYSPTKETRLKISEAHKNRKITWDLNPQKCAVNVYDLDGNVLFQFKSISDCSKKLNIKSSHISSCCKGKIKILNNKFIIRYLNDNFDLYTITNNKKRCVSIYDLNNNLLVKKDSLISASEFVGCLYQQIVKAIKLRKGRYKTFIFKYEDIV